MVKQITVNGVERKVTNTLSCGPGCEPHTYELTRGAYVYRVGAEWWLQERGQFKRAVTVSTVAVRMAA
jgi:hypothetical protein